MFYTPRFSYGTSNTTVSDVRAVPVLGTSVVHGAGAGRVGTWVGYTGVGRGGLYRVPTDLLKAEPVTAKRAP